MKNYCKGKRIDNNEWIIGWLVKGVSGAHYIFTGVDQGVPDPDGGIKKVKPETICTYTGFEAKKRKKYLDARIFEGDVFRSASIDEKNEDVYTYSVVVWVAQRGAFHMIPLGCYEEFKTQDIEYLDDWKWLFQDACLYDFSVDIGLTKVGNIHDQKIY